MSDAKRLRPGYHDLLRDEILRLVPTSATKILDLGCGTGELGKALKKRQKCYIAGIELNEEASQIAKKSYDKVWVDNLNRFDPFFLDDKFDCLVFADILEHLISPWQVLKKFASALTDDGVVIASIPNIAHPWIISQLQKGLWRYELAGLLDVTHLRFFTKTSIFQLFYRAGLKILNIKPYPSKENPIQHHITAVKPILEHANPLVTILILTFNCWRYTRQCINSIKARTFAPYRILVIDNGSTDETIHELRKDPQIFHIENSQNLGFGRGFNIGMELIDTPYFVIANNDVVVTKNWLTTMLKHINTDDKLVALGPVTNFVSGPQLIENALYKTERELETYAENRLQYVGDPLTYFHRIVFFFTLLKSDIMPQIGLLDERFELGNFEDDDYCMRINLKKLRLAIDNTVFIHHYGHQTFRENEISYAKTLEANKVKFMRKWNLTDVKRE